MLVVGIIATTLAAVMLLIPLFSLFDMRQRLAGTADTAALTAADAVRGLTPGTPCVLADRIAEANGVVVTGCHVEGFVVTVRVEGAALGLPLDAVATAGPPAAQPA